MKKTVKILLCVFCMLVGLSMAFACNGDAQKQQEYEIESTAELSLDKKNAILQPEETLTLTATLSGTEKTEEFIWKSYDEEIATVENGVVTARAFGTTYVTVNYGDLKADCKITVQAENTSTSDLQVVLSQTSVSLNAAYENAKTVTLSAWAYKGDELVQAEIVWESSDEEYVRVENGVLTAVKNGGSAQILARTVIDGVAYAAACNVVTEDEVSLSLQVVEGALEPNEQREISATLIVNGQPSEKKLSWSTSDSGVATVSDGVVKGIGGGKATVYATYGTVTKSVEITVRTYVYISTAEQFVRIGEGDENFVYVLTDNIDMGGYFAKHIWLNDECLIDDFFGTLDGCGYAVTNLTRYCNADERALGGVFGNIARSATIKNLYFDVALHTGVSGSLFAKQLLGTIENCYINIEAVTENANAYDTFSSATGSVRNSILNLSVSSGASLTAFASYGFAEYDGCLVIADALAHGAKLSGAGSDDNPYVKNCYVYSTVEDLLAGNGNVLDGAGKGSGDAQVRYGGFDSTIWSFDEKIALKNQSNATPIVAPTVAKAEDAAIDLTQTHTVQNQAASALTFDCYIVDGKGKTVHTFAENGVEFIPTSTGRFTVVSTLTDDSGVTGYATYEIVVSNAAKLNAVTKSFVLKTGDTGTIAVEGKEASAFYYYSANEEIASVNESGVIKANARGTTQILAVHKTANVSVTVAVEVVEETEIKTIATAEELLALNAEATGYYVLTNDIALTWSIENCYERVTETKTEYYACFIQTFNAVLDGNGHTISVKYICEDVKYISCGLFYTLGTESVIKNLHYEFYGEYKRPNSQFVGLFTYNGHGEITDCYMRANVTHLAGSLTTVDQEGFIAIAANPAANPTAYFTNVVFELLIENEQGEKVNGGYAIRYGSKGPYITECVFIRNGVTQTFFGQGSQGGSACNMVSGYFYRTLYDFVNAQNGWRQNTARVISSVSDGAPVYGSWNEKWKISEEGVYLLGRKVAEVSYEDYGDAPVMSVGYVGGSLTWSEDGAFDVYLNDRYVGTSSTGSFDLYSAIATEYGVKEGKYNIVVKNDGKGITGIAVVTVVLLTQENFMAEMRNAKTPYKHLVLSEDIRLNDIAFDNATNGTYMVWNTRYLVDEFAATLDGNGHTLSVSYEGSVYCGGLVQKLTGAIKNLDYEYYATYTPRLIATYRADQPRAFFVFALHDGARIENCFVSVNVTAEYLGEELDDPLSALFMQYFGNGSVGVSVRNNLFLYTVNGKAAPIMGYSVTQKAWFYDCVFIGESGVGDKVIVAIDPKEEAVPGSKAIGLQNCYVYPTVEDYLAGVGGRYASKTTFSNKVDGNGETTEVTGTQYDVLNGSTAWNITAEKIELCGTKIYPKERFLTVKLSGDTLLVSDTSIAREKVYDVYVGAEKVGSFTGKSCNLLGLLQGKLVAGENTFTVTVKTASGTAAETTATATYIGLTQENFLSVVSTSTADDYMVMLENVSIGEEDYLSKTPIWGYYYGIDLVQGTLDGLGHKISVTVDTYSNRAGLFKEISGTLKNLEYEITATYTYNPSQTNKGFFAFNTKQSTFENCYIHAKVTAYTTTAGTLTCTDTEAALIATAQNATNANDTTGVGSFKFCIFEMKRYDTETENFVDGKITDKSSYNVTMKNCVFLTTGEGGTALFGTFASINPGYRAVLTNCVKYATFDALLQGTGGIACEGVYKNDKSTYAETAIASDNAWSVLEKSSAWKITAEGITLCGVSIYTKS